MIEKLNPFEQCLFRLTKTWFSLHFIYYKKETFSSSNYKLHCLGYSCLDNEVFRFSIESSLEPHKYGGGMTEKLNLVSNGIRIPLSTGYYSSFHKPNSSKTFLTIPKKNKYSKYFYSTNSDFNLDQSVIDSIPNSSSTLQKYVILSKLLSDISMDQYQCKTKYKLSTSKKIEDKPYHVFKELSKCSFITSDYYFSSNIGNKIRDMLLNNPDIDPLEFKDKIAKGFIKGLRLTNLLPHLHYKSDHYSKPEVKSTLSYILARNQDYSLISPDNISYLLANTSILTKKYLSHLSKFLTDNKVFEETDTINISIEEKHKKTDEVVTYNDTFKVSSYVLYRYIKYMSNKMNNIGSFKKMEFVVNMLIKDFKADISEAFLIHLRERTDSSYHKSLSLGEAFFYLQNGANLNSSFFDYSINFSDTTSMHELIGSYTNLEKYFSTDD